MSRLQIFKEEKNKLEDELECVKEKFGSEVARLSSHLAETTSKFAN
jgi:uncharacterized membrane-anchored protein YhcB (DUF1043 family)